MIDGRWPYLSYLLRLWMVDDDGLTWRASLQSPSTAERHGFTSMEQLFTFLAAQARDLAAAEQWKLEQSTPAGDDVPDADSDG